MQADIPCHWCDSLQRLAQSRRASLAIAAKTPEPAAETLHSYLQHIVVQKEGADEDQQPGKKKLPCGHITKEQHLAAARLYTVEVL